MCGVAGIIAPYSSKKWRARIMDRLLVSASVRGTEATGICFVDPERGMVVVKDGKKAIEFVKQNEEYRKERDNFPAIVLGHTRLPSSRKAGSGPEDNKNNHPFFAKEARIAMIHNGHIDNDDNWRDTVGQEDGLRNKPEGMCDSEVMLCAVETYYLEEPAETRTMEDAIDHACYTMSGDYVLAFLKEDEPNKVYFVRHDNPLWLAWLPEEKAIVFGSTEDIIKNALEEYREHLDYFTEVVEPNALINEAVDEWMVTVEIMPEGSELPFLIKQRDLDCPKSDSRARHYVHETVPETMGD